MRRLITSMLLRSDAGILLAKRKADGLHTTPGGKVEDGDASVPLGAVRELREETGLIVPPSALHFLTWLEDGCGRMVFFFDVDPSSHEQQRVWNTEPHKHEAWAYRPMPEDALLVPGLRLLRRVYGG